MDVKINRQGRFKSAPNDGIEMLFFSLGESAIRLVFFSSFIP